MKLPSSLEDITPDLMQEMLSIRYPDVEVKTIEIGDIYSDNGVRGTAIKARVIVEYGQNKDAAPRSMIVKGPFEAHSMQVPWVYGHEIRYYNELRPRLNINMPDCFFAAADPSGLPCVVILEDLMLRQARFGHATCPLDFEQAAAFVDAFARFHADWWGHPSLGSDGELAWLEPLPMSKTYVERIFERDRWLHYLTLPRAGAIPHLFHDRERMRSAFFALFESRPKYAQVILHGDAHLSNTFIEGDGTVGFIDPQCRRGPWFQDVAYFLVSALDPLDRRRWERALIARYLDRIQADAVSDVPSFDDAFHAYAREIIRGLVVFTVNDPYYQSELVNTTYAARFATAAADHDALSLLMR